MASACMGGPKERCIWCACSLTPAGKYGWTIARGDYQWICQQEKRRGLFPNYFGQSCSVLHIDTISCMQLHVIQSWNLSIACHSKLSFKAVATAAPLFNVSYYSASIFSRVGSTRNRPYPPTASRSVHYYSNVIYMYMYTSVSLCDPMARQWSGFARCYALRDTTRQPSSQINTHSHDGSTRRNLVTLTFDLFTSESVHAEVMLPWSIRVPRSTLIAQVVYPLLRGHTRSHRCHWSPFRRIGYHRCE